MRRRALLGAACVVASGRLAGADGVDRLVETLAGARSFKLRVHAATLLGRLPDARALQALVRAAIGDPHPSVRMTALRALGRRGSDRLWAQQGRLAVARAEGDRDAAVRRAAAAALADLDRANAAAPRAAPAKRGPTVVAVGQMADRSGHASRAFRDRMREQIRALLGREAALRVGDASAPGVSFLIDGTVARLDVVAVGAEVQATCAVELVVSRPPRGIVTVASGEATVLRPRHQYRPQMNQALEEEALEHAVRGAHESLSRFLSSAGP